MSVSATPPATICILRLSALGDVTHVLPVVRAIRGAWPGTALTWIIGPAERQMLGDFRDVEFLVFDKRRSWAEWRTLRRQLAGRHFDILLHMQVSARANLLSRLIHAPVRIGWDRARSRDLHHWFVNRHIGGGPGQHQVPAFLEFAAALGIEPGEPRWDLPVSQAARAWVERRLDSGRPAVVISPCSSHQMRNWRPERYAAVADFVSGHCGAQVILAGGRSETERQMGDAITDAMRHKCLDLIGQDTLEQSKALLQRASLLISPDAGPVHIASALGTPVLGLYAATWSLRSGPYRSLELCIDRFPEAARRFRNRSPEELRWGTRLERPGVMDLVETDAVIERLSDWWGVHRRRG